MKNLNRFSTMVLTCSLLLQLSALSVLSHAAPGDVDLSFDPGSGVNGPVQAVAVQPDGKVIIAGQFTTVKGLARSKVARLNADGSGDSSFNAGTGTGGWEGYTHAVALQSDGKVLVSNNGGFSRLNSDGSPDTGFMAGTGFVCGDEGCYRSVYSIAVQPDGKLLVGGVLSPLNGANSSTGIARLNADGSPDGSFNPSTEFYSVGVVALQPDGKVLIGGDNRIIRLHADGNLDSSFNPGTGPDNAIYSIAPQSDGKVLIGGGFTTVNGTNRRCIARLNSDGSLDDSYNPGAGTDTVVRSIALQSDGKVLIGGDFLTVDGTNRIHIARLHADGRLDSSFNPGPGFSSIGNSTINSVVVQSDGKVLIGGNLIAVDGTNYNHLDRLNADGSQDSSFNPGREITTSVSAVVVQPDGKVLVGGPLTFINGTNRHGSARLNSDGSLDSTFVPDSFNPDLSVLFTGPPDYATISTVVVQPDGKVLIGGVFVHYQCEDDDCFFYFVYDGFFVIRVNADGTRDTGFEPVLGKRIFGGGETVRALALQPDGKILVGGKFHAVNGTSRTAIARLNANGTLDTGFDAGIGDPWNSTVSSLAAQPDGKMLYAIEYKLADGSIRTGIARLFADGSLDGSFSLPPPEGNGNGPILLQPDGKVLVGGFARLNADGSPDSTFNAGTGPNARVRSIALQPDGNVLISGDFTTVNGAVRPRVARLYGDLVMPALSIVRSGSQVILSWPMTGRQVQLQETTDLSRPDSWSPVEQPVVDDMGRNSVSVPIDVSRRFFRLQQP